MSDAAAPGLSLVFQPGPGQAALTRYVAGLDGLRAIAVMLVFLFHARVPGFGAGFFGVDLFFVLSGFLITGILLSEIARTGTVDSVRFLRRRVQRLVPALALMLAVFLALAPSFPEPPARPALQAVLTFAYLADYSYVLMGLPDQLVHTWSLAVEAKFYLIWPLILIVMVRRVGAAEAWKLIAVMALVATAWRVGSVRLFSGWDMTYYRFDTRISGLLIGAALAAGLHSGALRPITARRSGLVVVPIGVFLLLPKEWGDEALLTWGSGLVEIIAALLILAVINGPEGWVRWLGHPLLAGLGKLSYGFYLWHYPVIRWLRPVMDWPGLTVISFVLSLLLAWLSWVTVETLARRTRPQPAGSSAG